MATDVWRDECDDINIQCNDIMSEIQELMRLKRMNADTSKNSAKLRKMFSNLGHAITALGESMKRSHNAHSITEKEYTRRQDQITAFTRQRDHLLSLLSKANQDSAIESEKDDLLSTGNESSKKRVWGAPPKETEQTRLLDNNGVLQYQTTLMSEQDRIVESLRDSVVRQKHVAIAISNELDEQTVILKDLEDKVESAESKLMRTGRKLLDVSTKEGKWAMSFCCICILLAVLIGILVLIILL